jgi:hypothetical protein
MNVRRIYNYLLLALIVGQVIGGMWVVTQTHSFIEETTAKMEAYRSQN